MSKTPKNGSASSQQSNISLEPNTSVIHDPVDQETPVRRSTRPSTVSIKLRDFVIEDGVKRGPLWEDDDELLLVQEGEPSNF
jgi:hypothetical protein